MGFKALAASSATLPLLLRIAVATFEATLAYLAALILGAFLPLVPVQWPILFLVVLLAGAAAARWEVVGGERGLHLPTLIAALLVIVYATKIQVGGGLAPWGGWGALTQTDTALTYIALLVSLWCWWRGLGLPDRDHSSLVPTLRRAIVGITLFGSIIAFATAFIQTPIDPWVEQRLLLTVVALLGSGLISLVLARIVADSEASIPSDRWLWLRSGIATTFAILGVGVGALALVSDTAADILRAILVILVSSTAVILAPLAWLLSQVIVWFRSLGLVAAPLQQQPPPPEQTSDPAVSDAVTRLIVQIPTYILALLPLIALIIAILVFNRRRERPNDRLDERHESLFSWAAIGRDLRSLFRSRRESGLYALLQSLTARDPVTRIRRRYVQALILGEDRERPRQPAQTPGEYSPVLADVARSRPEVVQTLTTVYQRARYAPETTTTTDAEAADAAWQQLGTKEKSS